MILGTQCVADAATKVPVTLPNGWTFGEPINLGPTVNSNSNDDSPTLSADGLMLLFSSNRPDGQGGTDLWMAQIKRPGGTAAAAPSTSSPPLAIAPFTPEEAKQHQQAWADHLGIPVEFENSIGMEMVLIPPGEFMMGSSNEEVDHLLKEAKATNMNDLCFKRIPSESPRHRVRITHPFYLGVHEVTQTEFQRVMGNNPSYFSAAGEGKLTEVDTSQFPVEQLLWNEAQGFCRRFSESQKESSAGRRYRLPTEAEWEYACRAGMTGLNSFVENESALKEYAWFSGNSEGQCHPVGQKRPNPWGLFDMLGNVWEWCGDYFGEAFYAASPVDDPTGPSIGEDRILRGGSWTPNPKSPRSSFRLSFPPSHRYYNIGLRVVCEPPTPHVKQLPPRH